MLVLTRKIDKAIMIGNGVKVIVLGIRGNQIRIGIKASKDIKIYREEIYQRIQKDKSLYNQLVEE